MKIREIEGTLEEILAYEQAHSGTNELVRTEPEQLPPVEVEREHATDQEAIAYEIAQRKFKTAQAKFAAAYLQKAEEVGVQPAPSASSKSRDGWVDYLRFLADEVPVAFIMKTQVKFCLELADVEDIESDRLYKYNAIGKGPKFEAIIVEPTMNDLDLALELTRRAVEKAQQS